MKPNLLNLNSPIYMSSFIFTCKTVGVGVSTYVACTVRFLAARKMEREQRSSKLSFLVLCSETARKRLFGRRLLDTNVNGEAGGGKGVDGDGKERQLVFLLFKTLKRFRSHPESRLNSLSRAKISQSVPLR